MEYRVGLDPVHRHRIGDRLAGRKAARARNGKLARRSAATVEERERLRVTLASIGDAVIVTDDQGRVMSLNAVAESLTGWKTGDARGKPLVDVFRIVNEETRETVEDPCARVLRTGKIVGLANHTLLISQGRRGTSRSTTARRRSWTTSGAVCGVVVVFRDVSEKPRSRNGAAPQRSELADFFENAAIPLHAAGPDGIILRANQAELDMLGYSRDEYVGRHIASSTSTSR